MGDWQKMQIINRLSCSTIYPVDYLHFMLHSNIHGDQVQLSMN